MLGRKTLAANFAYAAAPVAFTPVLDAGTGENLLGMSFFVEEAEMFVVLEARITYHTPTPVPAEFTLFVDGADIALAAAGLFRHQVYGAAGPESVFFAHTLRLAQGEHTVELRMLSAEIPTIVGATIPAEVTARRSSHPATLGHGVDSKVPLIQ